MPSEAPVTSAHDLEGWPKVRSWDHHFSLIAAFVGIGNHTGVPGRTNRLSMSRANCTNLEEMVRKPTIVNVTKA